ncbi:glycosyltransferase [Paraburkholderia sp.]|jgi:glycosyltransferase involved in cell wall biosynthesis|uniref:glycosyltransferase n=1 Tax=Paraburkholderia sp. TaxID=1926495 RepID=UPI002F3F7FC2
MTKVKNADHPRASEPDRTPLRILFHINDFGRGGTETALLSWLRTLDRRLFSPSLSVAYPTDDLHFWRARSIPDDVPVHVLASSKWMHVLHQAARRRKLSVGVKLLHKLLTYAAIRPLAALRMRRLARQQDLICDFDFSLRHMAGSCNVPWFGVSHFSLAARLGNKSERYVARRVKHYSRYSAIAVLTPAMRREAQALFSAIAVDIVELPNVINVDALRRAARTQIESPAESFIVSVARLDEGQKDHSTLLRAYAHVRRRGRCKADLVLIGEGRDRQQLEQLADELEIGTSVHFLGFCADPSPFIRQAELLVLSSRYEGFGMVLGESMALGTPVLSSDCPTGPRDLLDDGKAGLLVPVGDVDAMASAIERLLTDTELRRCLVQRASQKIETFGPVSANQRMLELALRIRAKQNAPSGA